MPSEKISTSRRTVMQGATAGLVTAVAARAVAQTDVSNSTGTTMASPPQDPRTLYPHPPFPAQEQPWPGLAGRMTPRPDQDGQAVEGGCAAASNAAAQTWMRAKKAFVRILLIEEVI